AGRPTQKLKAWGSFEGWSDVVRSAVVWSHLPDPGETRQALRQESDQEANALHAILAGGEYLDALKRGLTVSRLLDLMDSEEHRETAVVQALREAIIMVCPARGRDFPSPQSVGMKFLHLKGRVVAGKCLAKRECDHTGVWFVKKLDGD